jgi:transposase
MMLTDAQWKQIEDLFPALKRRKDGRGRPWASNRSCFEGILWVLRVGARWRCVCPPNIPMALPAGVVYDCGKSRACGCAPGKRCWPDWISVSYWTGKKPSSTRPLLWRKRGLRCRKDPSRERYEVRGGGRRLGVPIGAQLASAQISEFRRAESTLARVRVLRRGRGRPRKRLRRVIADRGYDSDGLRQRLLDHGTELIAPYLCTRKQRRFEYKRKLRRYRRRWKIERTNAWLQNFRRVQVRYDRILSVNQGFFQCACLIITLGHLCN